MKQFRINYHLKPTIWSKQSLISSIPWLFFFAYSIGQKIQFREVVAVTFAIIAEGQTCVRHVRGCQQSGPIRIGRCSKPSTSPTCYVNGTVCRLKASMECRYRSVSSTHTIEPNLHRGLSCLVRAWAFLMRTLCPSIRQITRVKRMATIASNEARHGRISRPLP